MRWNRLFPIALLGLTVVAAPAAAAEVDKFLPDDTQMVLTINVRQLLDAPLIKKYARDQIENNLNNNQEAQQAMKALGIDPLKDVSSISIAAPGQADDTKVFGIIHGSFDRRQVRRAEPGQAEDHQGRRRPHL
jgi:hypothetical protein